MLSSQFSPSGSQKISSTIPSSSAKKKKSVQNSIRNASIILSLLLVLILMFMFIVYISHSRLGDEFGSTKQFVFNTFHKFQPTIPVNPSINHSDSPHELSLHYGQGMVSSEKDSVTLTADDFSIHNLTCPHADLVTFWKKPTASDLKYRTPYLNYGPRTKYVTFEPDVGGWNNIRMQMELVLVFAYATGRIFVMPPDQPMYLLDKGKGHQKAHSFMDFFPFDFIRKRMPIITMEEFMRREAITGHLSKINSTEPYYPPGNQTVFEATLRSQRLSMWEYLRNVTACPKWQALTQFLAVPAHPGDDHPDLSNPDTAKRQFLFAANRTAIYYDRYWQEQKVIHFISKPGDGYRLLDHFYTYIFFENVYMDRYFKRFVRDYVHYMDVIFCKAALIINKLKLESGGKYTAFHIRRGEFQYKVVKLSAEKLLHNVKEKIPRNRLVYVATDERNKTFFQAFKDYFPTVKYLDDYSDLADLKNVNPNYLGMIDQVVCSRAESFIGTWFSTFTGYITRMRGYLGYSDKTVWYGDMEHRDRFQKPENPKFPFYMREWNNSWYQIDDE